MRRFFNPLPRRLAGIVACTSIVLAACAGSEARSAIIIETRGAIVSEIRGTIRQAMPDTCLGMEGWQYLGSMVQNADCIGQSLDETFCPDYAPLPQFTPDDLENSDARPMTDSTIARNEPAPADPANIDASDDHASQSSDPNGCSDYYRFKFGHYDRSYGDRAKTDAIRNNDAGKNDSGSENAIMDDGAQNTPKTEGRDSNRDDSNNSDSGRSDTNGGAMPAEGFNPDSAKSDGDNSGDSNPDASNSDNEVEVAKSSDESTSGDTTPSDSEQSAVDGAAPRAEAYDLDFFRYKFSQYGQRFGKMLNLKPVGAQSSEEAPKTDEANKSDDAAPSNDATPSDGAAQRDDAANTDQTSNSGDPASLGEAAKTGEAQNSDDCAKWYDEANNADAATDGAAKSEDTASNVEPSTTDESPKTDDVSKSDDSSNNNDSADPSAMPKDDNVAEQNAGEQQPEDASNHDADISRSIEKYYGYRHESLEDRYGSDAGAAQPADGNATVPAADNGDSTNESTGSEGADNSVLARALLDVASRWAGDLSFNWGLNMPQFNRVLSWIY